MAPFSEGKNQRIAKGILTDKYRNRCRELKRTLPDKDKVLPSSRDIPQISGKILQYYCKYELNFFLTIDIFYTGPVHADFEQYKKWLKVSTGPWTKVLQLWMLTADDRLKTFRSDGTSITDAFREWPLYKDPNGHTLVMKLHLK